MSFNEILEDSEAALHTDSPPLRWMRTTCPEQNAYSRTRANTDTRAREERRRLQSAGRGSYPTAVKVVMFMLHGASKHNPSVACIRSEATASLFAISLARWSFPEGAEMESFPEETELEGVRRGTSHRQNSP